MVAGHGHQRQGPDQVPGGQVDGGAEQAERGPGCRSHPVAAACAPEQEPEDPDAINGNQHAPRQGEVNPGDPGGGRRDAVVADRLLAAGEGGEPVQGRGAEHRQPHAGDHRGGDPSPDEESRPSPRRAGAEQGERRHQRRRGFDRDAGHDGSSAARLARAEHQGDAPEHREGHQAVVVGSADHVHEHQRVERHKGSRGGGGDPAHRGQARDQGRGPQHREGRDRLQHPQGSRHSDQAQGVGGEREQRAVDARRLPIVLHPRGGEIVGDRGRREVVRVQPVEGPQASVGDVAEHVQRQKRGRQRERQRAADDRPPHGTPTQRARAHDHAEIGGEGDPERGQVGASANLEAAAEDAEQPAGGAGVRARHQVGARSGQRDRGGGERPERQRARRPTPAGPQGGPSPPVPPPPPPPPPPPLPPPPGDCAGPAPAPGAYRSEGYWPFVEPGPSRPLAPEGGRPPGVRS